MATSEPTGKASPPTLRPVRVPIPEEAVEPRVRDFREVLHAYTKDEAVLEAERCIQCRRPWCVEACPITQDCREYIRLIAASDFDGAARVTLRDDPLASCLCKVCYHYCEDACVVKRKGVPVAIRQLKRAALDFGKSDLVYVPAAPKHQRVAVVGAGPAGLMVAWDLGIRGYSITVFEQEERLGGLMQTIPPYRMTDRDVEVDRARFRDLDVTFVPRTKVGEGLTLDRLRHRDGYAAVVLTMGTPVHRTLGVPGEELPGVVPALGFLRALGEGHPVRVGQQIVVVGGGDVAMDSVRSARRLSPDGSVTLVYRRSRAEMPADPEEVHGAEEEGVAFVFQKAPVRVVGSDRVEGLVVQSVELGAPDAGGRRRPEPIPGSEATIPCDTLLVAVGQQADLRGIDSDLSLTINARGWPEGKGRAGATAAEGVFATGGRSVVYAMGAAMEVADAVDAYLAGLRGGKPTPRPDPLGGEEPFHRPAGYTTPIRV